MVTVFIRTTRIYKAVLAAILPCFMVLMIVLVPNTAFASSIQLFAASPPPQNTCVLPDGSKNGIVLADGHTCCPPPHVNAADCLFAKYINPAIALISAAVGVAIAIAIIVGGIEYITSAGDPQRAASGKKRIVNALIGLVAFALLFAFLQFIIPGGVLNG